MSAQEHGHDEHLPEKDAALLAQALAPHEPDAERAAQMKAKILRGIAAGRDAGASQDLFAQASKSVKATRAVMPAFSVRAHERTWVSVARGVEMCTLHEDDNSRSLLLRMQAGSFLLPHRHTMSEESILLEGDAIIGEDLDLKAGDFHFSPAGALHPLLQSPSGCIVYVRGEKEFHPRVTMGLFKRMLRGLSARTGK